MPIKAQRQAFNVAVIYVIVAAVWILFSDELVGILIRNPEERVYLSMLKGWLFVATTGGLLYLVLRRVLTRWEQEVERRRSAEISQGEVGEQLRLKEEQLRLVMEGSADGLWDWDLRSGKVDLSLRYWEICGCTPGAAVVNLEFFKKRVHPADWPAVKASMKDHLAGKTPQSVLEYRLITPAGTEKWLWGRGKVVARAPDGSPLRMAGTVSDITLRKHAELALQESQALYHSLVAQLPIGIFQKDQAGRYVLVNPAFCRLKGLAAADFLGKTPAEVAAGGTPHSDSTELVAKYAAVGEDHHRQIMQSGLPIELDEEYTLAGGRKHFVHAMKLPILAPGGKVIGTQGVIFDITERKQAEEALRQSQERYVLTERAVNDGLWDWNLVTDEDFLSPRWKAIVGYQDDELPNLKATFLKLVHPDDLPLVQAVTRDHLTAGKPYRLEYRLRHKDGTDRWVFSRGEAVRDAAGRPIRMFGAVTDITERKRVEAALRESLEKFAKVFSRAPVLIAITNLADGTYVDVNDQALETSGYTRAEVIGRSAVQLGWLKPEDRAFLVREIQEHGRVAGLEQEFRTKDGRRLVGWVNAEQLSLLGRPCLLTVTVDITARKRAEADLRFHQKLLEETGQIAQVGGWSFDVLTGAGFWTAEVARIHELDPTVPVSKEMGLRFYTGESRPKIAAAIAQAIQHGRAYDLELEIIGARGTRKWVRTIGHPVQEAGQVVRVSGSFQDITARRQAETALRESEAKYRNLFTNSPDAILTLDAVTGMFTSGNPATLALFTAQNEAEFFGHSPLDLSPPTQTDGRASAVKAREMMAIASDTGSHIFEWTHRRLNGEDFPAEVRLHRMEQDGKMLLQATVRDITQRKRMEAEIRRVSQWLLHTQRISQVGGWTINLATGAVWVSPEAVRIYGLPPEASIDLAGIQAFPLPHYRPRLDEALRELVAGRAPYDLEFQIMRATDHALVDIHSVAEYQPDESLVIGVIEDITGRKQIEAARSQLATVVEQCAETIVITDPQGAILYANPAFEKTTGYTRAEALGQNPRVLKSGRQPAAFYQEMWATLARGEVWHGHFINRRKDGTDYEEDATITPVRDAAGVIVSYAAVKRDVTHEVQLEDQLRQSQKMEGIGQLAGGVAHDFNNILSSLIMQTELLEMTDQLSGEALEGLQQIRADANRAADLTRQLLLFSRRQVMQSRDLDLNEVVMNLVKMLQRIIGEDVHLQLNLHSTPLLTHADAGMMDQVLMNLAVNARDAMPQGGRLRIITSEKVFDDSIVGRFPDAAPGRYVCLSVSDTGGGIPPVVLPHIFEPFFTTKEAGKGTGLGLATVFGIVKQHHGWLKVDNQPGHGVTFEVYIPALATEPAAAGEAVAPVKLRGGTETILLVEDELSVRVPARIILKRQGYQVLEAANGPEALILWRQHREHIALLLTDLVMPGGVSGQDLARQFVAEQPKLRVAFVSGYSPNTAGRELKLQSGQVFIQKPFTTNQLLLLVRQCLDA